MAEFEEIRLGRANVLLIGITEQGWESLGDSPPTGCGRGQLAHQHIAHWVMMVGKKRGCQAELEWIVPGTNHPTDVVWLSPDSRRRAFEIVVTCEENLESHIQACFAQSNAVDELTIVVTQKAFAQALEQKLHALPAVVPFLNRIHIDIVETYLRELWP
jgi:hypothetical protein